LKRKTKGRKFLFSQKESLLENKELPKTKELKKIERLLRGNRKNFRLWILKTKLKDQKPKEEKGLKNGENEN
jgi:hypothetical protein